MKKKALIDADKVQDCKLGVTEEDFMVEIESEEKIKLIPYQEQEIQQAFDRVQKCIDDLRI